MHVYIPILFLASLAMAEPPVGDGYPAARSLEHQHEHAEQRSLSEEYGVPSSRDSLSYSSRAASRSYSPPTARVSFTQRFNSAASSRGYAAARLASTSSGISQDYNARSLSQQYGAPAARSISTEYGAPEARTPAQEYGAPVAAARSNEQSFRNAQPGKSYSAPRSQFQDSLFQARNAKSFSKSAPSSTYGAPSSRLSSTYGVPSARDSDSYALERNSISQSYGAPSQRDLTDTYAAPSVRGLSQEYGVPSSRSNLKTDAIASSYASARSAPSSSYLPSARDSIPLSQYGVPEDQQGYDEARARALEELLNQEPANYDFSYQIEDQESGGDFGHTETRLEDRAEGSYFVVLPDGTKQTVQYSADEGGFKPRISVEPVGGYDDNAQDTRAGGPY